MLDAMLVKVTSEVKKLQYLGEVLLPGCQKKKAKQDDRARQIREPSAWPWLNPIVISG